MSKIWNMKLVPKTAGWKWGLIPADTHFSHLKGDGPVGGVWYTLEPQTSDPNAPLDVIKHSFVSRNLADMVTAIQAAESDSAKR